VADESDAEDILQDVFYELVEAYRMMKPVQQVSAWLFRVARNRITDLFGMRRPEAIGNDPVAAEDEELLLLEDLLPSLDAGPDAVYARDVLLEGLDAALDELPEEQREIFIALELEGYSFKELAAATGLSVNTLLSRKHYAMLCLREHLQGMHEEFRKLEENRNEKELDVEGTEVRVVRGTGCSCIEFCGDESLELVDAGAF
jgi:RNA polymerase sigma factor (sigma-70 family)